MMIRSDRSPAAASQTSASFFPVLPLGNGRISHSVVRAARRPHRPAFFRASFASFDRELHAGQPVCVDYGVQAADGGCHIGSSPKAAVQEDWGVAEGRSKDLLQANRGK
jgi:hypothetical protein